MSSRRSPFPSTRSGGGTSVSHASSGRTNYSIRAGNVTASVRSSVPASANRSRNQNPASTGFVNGSAVSPMQEDVPQHRPGYGGFGDYIPGVRQHTPHTEALAQEIDALRSRGKSESPRETQQPRLAKRRDHSTYLRGPDATGFHIPNPTRETFAGVMSQLPETPDMTVNRDVLERTLLNTFYSTRMKYNESRREAHLEMSSEEDEDDAAHRSGRSPADAMNGESASARVPIDNPRFWMPKMNVNSNYYNSNHKAEDHKMATKKDGPGDTSGTEDSETSSSEEENENGSKSKSEESGGDEDPEYKLQCRKKKQFEERLLKEKMKKKKQTFETLKSKGDVGRVFGERSTTPVRVAAMKPELANSWTRIRAPKSEPGKNIAGTGFLRDLYKKDSILGKHINEIQKGLEALTAYNRETPEHNLPFAPIAPFPELKTQQRLINCIPTPSLSPHRKLIENPQKANFAANQPLRNRGPKSAIAAPSQSSIEIAEKVKGLHERVIDIIPPNDPNRKMLMGKKNLLSASPSHARNRSRQRVPPLATKSGLTIATPSSDMDPMDDLFREHSRLSDAATYSTSKARREVQTLKQKLGIAPGLRLKPSLNTLSDTFGSTLERPTTMYLNAQLKFPRTSKSGKLARDQFQARDAQMIAARRQAILAKTIQQRSKYLLTDTELKQKVKENRPSRLLQSTQASLQRMEPTLATYVPKQRRNLVTEQVDEVRRSRFAAASNSFKASPTIQSIPRRAVPAWRSI